MPPVPNGPSERMRQMLVHLLPAICASMLGASACQQDQPTGVTGPRVHADLPPQRDTALAPSADTYIRQGSPNQNQGAEVILRLQSSGKMGVAPLGPGRPGAGGRRRHRHVCTPAAHDLQPGRQLEHGRPDDRAASDDAGVDRVGRDLELRTDSVPGNSKPDCTGATAWDMDHSAAYPFVAETSATARLRNGQTGVVSFDVTADVLAWLSGQPNDGWVLKKTVEGDPGMVDFGSRECATPPQLVLQCESRSPAGHSSRTPIPTLDTSLGFDTHRDRVDRTSEQMSFLCFKPVTLDSTEAASFARNSCTLGVTCSG